MAKELSKELSAIIVQVVDVIANRSNDIEDDLRYWKSLREGSLEQLASIAELKIKRNELKKIRKDILRILKTSSNKIILSTMQVIDN